MKSSLNSALIRFLSVYTFLILLVIISASVIYYKINIDRINLEYKTIMQEFAILQTRRLKWLHNHFPKYNKYPRDDRYNSAIYDLEYTEIFSTMKSNKIDFSKSLYFTKKYVIYLSILSDYYLGAKYLFIEIPKNPFFVKRIYKKIFIFATVALVVLFILGIYLAKLFVKPMQESIELLDKFIKDTTHEINTPISIINTNIEMVNTENLKDRERKILNRVKIASRTLESIYKDLKFITLEQNKKPEFKKFNLKELIKERVEYFSLLIESKKIKTELNLSDFYVTADVKLISRVVDNLISNAIKYNKVGGKLSITIQNSRLIIEDSGIGIKKEDLNKIFNRYARFNSSEGGFGIGLSIVKQIIDIHNLKIDIESQENKGTKVIIKW